MILGIGGLDVQGSDGKLVDCVEMYSEPQNQVANRHLPTGQSFGPGLATLINCSVMEPWDKPTLTAWLRLVYPYTCSHHKQVLGLGFRA